MKPGVDYVGVSTPFYCNDGHGLFLLHKRSAICRDEANVWDVGSGELDYACTPEKNVLREVLEEYGCQGVIQEKMPAHSVVRTWQGHKTHWLAIPFFVKVNPKEVRNNEPEKMSEITWFKLDSLPQPLHTGFNFTLNKYPDYFKKYRV